MLVVNYIGFPSAFPFVESTHTCLLLRAPFGTRPFMYISRPSAELRQTLSLMTTEKNKLAS